MDRYPYAVYLKGEYHGNQAHCFTPGGLRNGWGGESNATRFASVKGAREYVKYHGLPFGCEIVNLDTPDRRTVAKVHRYRR